MTIINMHDAKTQLSDLVARAEAGEEIIIARRNKPAVRLVAETGLASGFGEEVPAPFNLDGLAEAVKAGREFTIMQDGKALAQVSPVAKQPRKLGALAHLAGNLPPDLFLQPLSEDELQAWEGKYSYDPDKPDDPDELDSPDKSGE